MALKHHPDKNPNNPEATEKVSCSSQIIFCFVCASGLVICPNQNQIILEGTKTKIWFYQTS